jgi:hypothetical protein
VQGTGYRVHLHLGVGLVNLDNSHIKRNRSFCTIKITVLSEYCQK